MKPVQIVLLVIAGALGGAFLTRSWNKPKPATTVSAEAQPPATSAPTPAPAPAATEPESPAPAPPVIPVPEPVHTKKPSTAPRKMVVKQHPVSRPAPPPANPRPVETARVEPQTPATETRPEPAPAPVVSTPPVRPEPEPPAPAPPPPPEPNRVTLNAGILLPVRLIDGLTTERNAPGDTFTGTLDHELVVDGFVIAERGARVEGRVTGSDRGGKVKGVSFLSVELSRLHTADGQTVAIQTDPFERRAEATHTNDAAKVGGGAALGAIIGAIAGGGKGAAIGAAAGGGAGAGAVVMTRGKAVTLPSETRISFRLRAPVTITEHR
jgi:hypothetical protein